MIRVAICDDSRIRLQEKRKYLEYCKKVLPIEWDIFSFEKEYAKEMLNHAIEFSIFFIHKDMKHVQGIEVAKMVRSLNQKALIVFMTENIESMLPVFDVVIFNCLIEPVTMKNFYGVLERAVRYIGNLEKPFHYRYFQKDNTIEQDHILFFEKNKRKVYIHTLLGVKECYMTMEKVRNQINMENFGRSHNSYIINFSYVERITSSYVELINGKRVDVSRTYKKEFRDRFLEYINKKS